MVSCELLPFTEQSGDRYTVWNYFISNYVARLQLRNWPPFCTDTDTIQILYVCRLKNVYTKTYVNVINRTLLYSTYYHRVSWKQRPLRPPKTPKLENKDPPYFSGLRNYDQSVANMTVSWALVTRILGSWTDIRGIGFVLNWKILCFVSSKELTPCLFEVFNFHRK